MWRQENQKPFVRDFIKWAGYPRWDKAVSLGVNIASRESGGGSEYVVIPFAIDGESKTSALVIATITGSDTVLRTVYKNQYQSLPYATGNTSALTAEKTALLFMGFDNSATARLISS